MKRTAYLLTLLITAALTAVSCLEKHDNIEDKLKDLDQRISKLEEAAGIANNNSIAIHALLKKETIIVGFKELEHSYELELSDGKKITVTDGVNAPAIVPIIGIDSNGDWIMSIDNGETFTPIQGAANALSQTGQTPQIKVDDEGFWLVSIDGGKSFEKILGANGKPQSAVDGMITGNISTFFEDVTFDKEKSELVIRLKVGDTIVVPVIESFYLKAIGYEPKATIFLNQTLEYKVEVSDVQGAFFQMPHGWSAALTDETLSVTAPSEGTEGEYTINLVLTSVDGHIRHIEFTFTLNPKVFNPEDCQIYNDWLSKNENNVLLDFSYAGYNHGESAPAEGASLGYTVYNVTDYGAVAGDGKSDRAAFIRCVEEATGKVFEEKTNCLRLPSVNKANVIIYFPEGEFILHTSEDDVNGVSRTLQIRAGNFVLRGAGRDKTTIVMQDKNLPTDKTVLYSSPLMLDFKHDSGIGGNKDVKVSNNAAKGAFSVQVADGSRFAADEWVCLCVQNNDPAYVAKELEEGKVVSGEIGSDHDIIKNGVKVFEYHQIQKVEGNTVTFYEPIHHEVDITYTNFSGGYNWSLKDYPHYENVGIEDLTFKGNAKEDFKHHGSWEDDGAFKPLGMTRLVNSWLRRVRFTSVSEACSVTSSANCSVYDVEFDGNRGHSSIRSAQSTRIFIGATIDRSNGPLVDSGVYQEGSGQYHAVGVSKPSIGTVLWRNVWGSDSCFEAHATQPRATLIDCCKGGWMHSRQGGDENQVPNHLADLTIWNFNATNTPDGGTWDWWNHSSKWWKFLPPIVVGFHGNAVTFNPDQTKVDFSNGIPVNPESLYEAQLKERLGAVPAWLNSLK